MINPCSADTFSKGGQMLMTESNSGQRLKHTLFIGQQHKERFKGGKKTLNSGQLLSTILILIYYTDR